MNDLLALPAADVLAFGAHPDDIEMATAGTLLLLRQAGSSFVLLDATRGEMGSRGTAQDRATEATAASRQLGAAARGNLQLRDAGVRDDDEATNRLCAAVRAVRPRLLLAPHPRDQHPDHAACAKLAERAFFLAGLRNYHPELGAPHRPRVLLRYPGNQPIEPTLVVDISAVMAAKTEVVRCYASQLQGTGKSHMLQGLDVLERAQVRDRSYGSRIGAVAGEAFWHDGPLPFADLRPLLA